MIVGIISDSHDRLPALQKAVELFTQMEVDALFHAGDFVAPFAAKLIAPDTLPMPLHCIYGNNDGERAGLKKVLPDVVDGPYRTQVDGKTIVMHHFLDWMEPVDYADADVVISGHDHTANLETRDGTLFINPGECCGWLTDRCTVAKLDLTTLTPELIEIRA